MATVAVGKRPFGVTIDHEGALAFTANVQSDDVSIVDLASRKVLATVAVGSRPYAVAIAGGKAFVTNQHGESVSVIDLASRRVIKTIAVGSYPEGVAATPDGKYVFVACWDANTLERIDVKTLEVTGKTAVADGPRAFGGFLR